ncbi:acetolactate synthase small subunit [Dehalogenimonas alkenigignens]|uniref:Acetolactate synthase small subunit n=1 Tax=Dehalogenimonas alkenigignens TaxID=1217799 RepID=A0A0W0GJF1_9CHLR|nr:acetolactate synthase small subunit [Dehalogenimonas alkenigignens]KTB48682.1 acetolactate synthase, small subunit [Dehalogenimonas alkenigignens]PVV84900.1 acetolactate synthase small subunit [Dehalogenimonas alkenigignens]
MASNKHTIVALVADRPGVLNRMASLFRRRGFNIDSIAVGHSETPHLSRMTIVAEGSDTQVEQIRKQVEKIVDVIRVQDISGLNIVSRELALIKVKSTPETRSEIMQIVDIFRAKIVDVSADSVMVEATGDEEKVDSLYNLLKPFGVKEISRTGRIAMARGDQGNRRDENEG